MTSAPIFFTVKFILLCSGHKVEDSHLITVQIIDVLLPLASRRLLSFHKRQFNKHNLDQHLLLHWLWQETLHSECKYMHTARAHSGVKRKPIDRAWKEFFSWFICCYIDFLFVYKREWKKEKTEENETRVRNFFFWSCNCCEVASIMSDSVQPHGLQPTRLLRPWDSPVVNITPNRTAGLNRMCLNLVFSKFFLSWVANIHYCISFRCIT